METERRWQDIKDRRIIVARAGLLDDNHKKSPNNSEKLVIEFNDDLKEVIDDLIGSGINPEDILLITNDSRDLSALKDYQQSIRFVGPVAGAHFHTPNPGTLLETPRQPPYQGCPGQSYGTGLSP